MRKILSLIHTTAAVVLISSHAQAMPVSGNLPSDTIREVIVVPASTDSSHQVESSQSSRFSLKPQGNKQRLGFIDENNAFLPVLLGIKNGKKIVSVNSAQKKDLCRNEGAVGLTVLKKALKGAKFEIEQIDGENAYASLKSFKVKKKNKRAVKKIADKASTVAVGSDCAPEGNATTQGIGSSKTFSINAEAATGDTDADGLLDELDSDADGDGILNPYDPDFSFPFRTFYLFSNLKVTLENALNSNTGVTITRPDVDSLLSNFSILAVEVKADSKAGEESELDCGSLNYCSTGGTGKVSPGGDAFPGALGGTLDPDSDGNGTITQGSTNDFQLQTGASLPDINGGDTFVQTVTDSSGGTTKYLKSLDMVFKSTPAIKSIVVNPGTAEEVTHNITYPVSAGDLGTDGNCIEVGPDGDDNLNVQLVVWGPQRKGVTGLGEGEFVDLGGSEITIDIPNKPCSTTPCSDVRSPNNCTASTYSESDANLSISGDMLLDSRSDADADPANTLTFTVDLEACLAESSDTLDAGEQVWAGVQFRSVSSTEGSDNAAVRFCMQHS